MLKLEIGLVDGGDFNIDKSSLQIMKRKKLYAKSYFKGTLLI